MTQMVFVVKLLRHAINYSFSHRVIKGFSKIFFFGVANIYENNCFGCACLLFNGNWSSLNILRERRNTAFNVPHSQIQAITRLLKHSESQ